MVRVWLGYGVRVRVKVRVRVRARDRAAGEPLLAQRAYVVARRLVPRRLLARRVCLLLLPTLGLTA